MAPDNKSYAAEQTPHVKGWDNDVVLRDSEPRMVMTLEEAAMGGTPYVTFDVNRAKPAFRPHRSSIASTTSVSGSPPDDAISLMRSNHDLVPLQEMTCDVRTLNMHLALRVQEILACAEEMWRFVVDYQEKNLGTYSPPPQPTHRAHVRSRSHRPFHEDLLRLRREDFDGMLTRFRL